MAEAELRAAAQEALRGDGPAGAASKEFGYKNEMQVPRIDKIVLNMGVGEATARFEEGADRRRRPRA